MSRFLTKNEDGTYLEEIESIHRCKMKINEVCCNDKCKHLGNYCWYDKTECKEYIREDSIIEKQK
jgi:hypothetical protein